MILNIKNIRRDFGDFKLDLDLEIESGKLVSLLGPSGCGKSTTLRIIAGFEEPDGGALTLDGRNIIPVPAEKRNIGMVFQDYALFPHMTVFDNIAYGPKIRKWPKSRIEKSVGRFSSMMHLHGLEKRRIDKLSGGEQQRVALARALVTEPDLLLLDEPLSALDAKLRKGLRREIRILQQELGITTVYVTHDQDEALAISDKIAVMNGGRCIQYDTPENLYRRPSHVFSAGFLGNSNLIPVDKVVDIENKIVETSLGTFRVSHMKPDSEEKTLFFRPDKCKTEADLSEENTFSGIISGAEYSGTHRILEIQSGNRIIQIWVEEDYNVQTGDNIIVGIAPEYCRVL